MKFSRSVILFCDILTDIRERDRFVYCESTYEVKGVTTYGNIRRAVAEAV